MLRGESEYVVREEEREQNEAGSHRGREGIRGWINTYIIKL